jgi:cytochrome P450
MRDSTESPEQRARTGGVPVIDFDIELDPRFHEDPIERWRFASSQGPIFYSSSARGFWVITRYDLAREILQRPAEFSSRELMVFSRADLGFHDVPTQLDPPDHVLIRRLIQPLLSSAAVARLVPGIEQLVRELLGKLRGRPGCEFNSAFGLPLTGGTIARAMGIPSELEADMVELALDVAHPERSGDSEHERHRGSTDRIAAMWIDLISERRNRPREDWISYLATSRLDGEPLDDALIRRLLDTLFRAGFDTTAGTLAYAFHYLASHPDERLQLSRSRDLIPAAVEEMLRCFGADVLISRTATDSVNFHGIQMSAGDSIILLLAAANRDSAAFAEPDDVKVAREPNQHLGFGIGPHRCVGLHLALAELRVALDEWHVVIPDYALATDQTLRHEVSETARLSSLNLVFGPQPLPGARKSDA